MSRITSGGFIPASILKQQEHQRTKLAKDFKTKILSEIKHDPLVIIEKPIKKAKVSDEIDHLSSFFEGKPLSDICVPASILKQQEHQLIKLADDFKNKPVFLETKIESTVVNKTVAKKTTSHPEPKEMIWEEGACYPLFIMERQDHEEYKNEASHKKMKVDMLATFVEEKVETYSDKIDKYSFVLPKQRPIKNTTEILRTNKIEYEAGSKIGQEFLTDCGFDAHWVFKCAPWKNLPICVDNESDGAWVPFIILYRVDYYECMYVKETGHGREFSQDHGEAYD